MTVVFKPAVMSPTATLSAFAGPTGSGKTYTALRFARGLAGASGKIAFIDTEHGRANYYANEFEFDHADLASPFEPQAYRGAIADAIAASYSVIIVDSLSHMWEGIGGMRQMQEEDLDKLAKGNAEKMKSMSAAAWRRPKNAFQIFLSDVIATPVHIIFCLRAREKIKFVKDEKGKTQIVNAGFQPIMEGSFMFEMMISFMLDHESPGIGVPMKVMDQHRMFFSSTERIGEEAGKKLAEWAEGQPATPAGPTPAEEKEKEIIGAIKVCDDLPNLQTVWSDAQKHWAGLSDEAKVRITGAKNDRKLELSPNPVPEKELI